MNPTAALVVLESCNLTLLTMPRLPSVCEKKETSIHHMLTRLKLNSLVINTADALSV